ncbi:guanine nucleotide exchange c9orf72 [Anaeramoeba flamelloides]|uniref:Guanine nucleotide exchange c9orf72 n=1 Tax=Anaeramoeba flamelloides TaxID=1746091 RepID=A0AAV7Y8T4_9EUKA|nr:guanine nucleotide exchange c9orf72 [Anaeramoeba flamelloides]
MSSFGTSFGFSKPQEQTIPLGPKTKIASILFSLWDNVLGPRTQCIWVGTKNISVEVQKYLAKNTLSSDLGKCGLDLDTGFHIVPNLGYVISSVSFTAPVKGEYTRLSLSLLLHQSDLDQYLPIYHLIEQRLEFLAQNITQLLQNDCQLNKVIQKLNKNVQDFQIYTDQHLLSGIKRASINDTFWFSSTDFEFTFLEKALTSHFQTFGCSVVSGSNQEEINFFIDSLSIIQTPNEHRLSTRINENENKDENEKENVNKNLKGDGKGKGREREREREREKEIETNQENKNKNKSSNSPIKAKFFKKKKKKKNKNNNQTKLKKINSDYKSKYLPDLFVQPFFGDNLLPSDIIKSYYPTTWINLDTQTIYQSKSFDVHLFNRKNFFQNLNEKNIKKKNLEAWKEVKHSAKFVRDLLKVVFRLPNFLRERYIQQWITLINSNALVLIKFRDYLLKEKGEITRQDIREIKSKLKFSDSEEYRMILAVAEKLDPGISFIDKKNIEEMEKRFGLLF